MLEYKAAEAGARLIRVPPRGTSQTCPAAALSFRSRSMRGRIDAQRVGSLSTVIRTRLVILFGSA